MATYSVDRLNWKCMVCGATNNIGPCPNCGNRTYNSWQRQVQPWDRHLQCTKCEYEHFYSEDPRLTCEKCGKFTPLSKSGLKLSGCFIAAAAYGSPYTREVETLRKYRDAYLQQHVLGRAMIRLYEQFSPPLANWIAGNPLRRQFVRKFVMPPLLEIARRRINSDKDKTTAG